MLEVEREFNSNEKRILALLYPDNINGLRDFTYKLEYLTTTTAKRALISLKKRGYVKNDKKPNWRRGQKINYRLTVGGKRAAVRMMVGEKAKHLFIGILENLRTLAMKPGGGGDNEIQIALDIYDLLDTPEAGESIKKLVEKMLKNLG